MEGLKWIGKFHLHRQRAEFAALNARRRPWPFVYVLQKKWVRKELKAMQTLQALATAVQVQAYGVPGLLLWADCELPK
jgi:hypothetical protein